LIYFKGCMEHKEHNVYTKDTKNNSVYKYVVYFVFLCELCVTFLNLTYKKIPSQFEMG
jgi:hypothetical protein